MYNTTTPKNDTYNVKLSATPQGTPTIITEDMPIKKNVHQLRQEFPNDLQIPDEDTATERQPLQHKILSTETETYDEKGRWEPIHHANNFGFIHFLLCNTIEKWMAAMHVKTHPFYAEWQKATYKDITSYTAWDKICSILHITNYEQYIKYMSQCPMVNQMYKLKWDRDGNIIQH